MNDLEVTILSNLIYHESTRKVLPFLRTEYFQTRCNKVIFLEIHEYVSQYDALPSLNAIGIEFKINELICQKNSLKKLLRY